MEIVEPQGEGFQVQPKRWIVERTWTWLENARGLCRDYETLAENHQGMIYIVMIRLMLRLLANNRRTRRKMLNSCLQTVSKKDKRANSKRHGMWHFSLLEKVLEQDRVTT